MAQHKGKDLLVGAVVGTVLGAVSALLFAPKSGRELRADIAEGYQQVSEKTQQIAGDVAQKSKQLASSVVETTSDWAGKAKDAAVQAGQGVKSFAKSKGAGDEVAAAEASVAATAIDLEEQQ